MSLALECAETAKSLDEVPVGAVIVRQQELITQAYNQPIAQHDPTAHAEIVALRQAAKTLGNYRLPGTTLYVTLEPCSMCLGALIHARIERLVIAARDPKTGACGGAFNLLEHKHNHQIDIQQGLMETESANLLRQFFQARR